MFFLLPVTPVANRPNCSDTGWHANRAMRQTRARGGRLFAIGLLCLSALYFLLLSPSAKLLVGRHNNGEKATFFESLRAKKEAIRCLRKALISSMAHLSFDIH